MPDQLQLRGGTTAQNDAFTGAAREVTVDTTKDTLVVHDASTAGGNPLMREDGANSELVLGSAATPSLKFTGDTNTGIFSPGADQVAVSTGGTERVEWGTSEVVFNDGGNNYDFRIEGDTNTALFFVDASADAVGVGTTSPTAPLSVVGGTGADPTIYLVGASNDNARIGSKLNLTLACNEDGTESGRAITFNNHTSEFARIDSSGRVGIGTSSPAALLHLADNNPHIRLEDENDNQDWEIIGSDLFRIRDITNSSADRFVINSSGNVGIGTTSPNNLLSLAAASGGAYTEVAASGYTLGTNSIYYGQESTGDFVLYNRGNNHLQFGTNNTERARIDNLGRLLVGTSSSTSFAGWGNPQVQVRAANSSQASLGLIHSESNNNVHALLFGKIRGTGIVHGQDELGRISWQGYDGSAFRQCAEIMAVVDGTPGASDMPGRLVFSTTADGASSPTERMRIKSNGSTLIGGHTSEATYSSGISFGDTPLSTSYMRIGHNSTGATYSYILFGHGSADIGSIQQNSGGTAVSYNTTSDYRLKENVVDLDGAIDRIKQLAPKRFNFIADAEVTVDGFLAHEAQAVVPEAVSGEKDAVDAGGNPVYQGIDQSKLVPLLTAALQEAIAKIETLEANNVSLEARLAALEAN